MATTKITDDSFESDVLKAPGPVIWPGQWAWEEEESWETWTTTLSR